jgi:hypothetical protein
MLAQAERLGGFSAALLDPTVAAPPGLVGPDGEPSPRRFAVYRNNVVVGLTEAMKANFPAVARIVGDRGFLALAKAYAASAPPLSPVLSSFGHGFPDFIARFEPAAELPWLADVARLEWSWLESYHSADAAALSPDALASLPPERAGTIVFAIHPSLRLVRSRFPVLTIWSMNSGLRELGPVDFEAGGADALVLRPDAEVAVQALPPGAYAFVKALVGGKILATAMAAALDDAPDFDLAANLRALIAAGAFAGFRLADHDHP